MPTLSYLSSVSGLATGLAGSSSVTPQTTTGAAAPATAVGATTGTIFETSASGTYICLMTYTVASMPIGTLPWGHWSVGGTLIDDTNPTPVVSPQLDNSGYALNSMTQPVPTSNTPGTTGDSLNAARAQAFGAWAWVALTGSTSQLILYAPDGVTSARTFTINCPVPTGSTVPTSRT